jgi:hypothetical protein
LLSRVRAEEPTQWAVCGRACATGGAAGDVSCLCNKSAQGARPHRAPRRNYPALCRLYRRTPKPYCHRHIQKEREREKHIPSCNKRIGTHTDTYPRKQTWIHASTRAHTPSLRIHAHSISPPRSSLPLSLYLCVYVFTMNDAGTTEKVLGHQSAVWLPNAPAAARIPYCTARPLRASLSRSVCK